MHIDVPTLVLGALGGATVATATFLVPLGDAKAFLPAAVLVAAGLAVHLGVPVRKPRATVAPPDHPAPAKTPIAWMGECGALGPRVDRETATRIVRARLETEFRAQPTADAAHVRVLGHIIDLAAGKRSGEGQRTYDAFVAKAKASIAGKPHEASAALGNLAAGLPGRIGHPTSHGTVTTDLMARLADVRKTSGVLPTSDFLWLKSIDRPLWYALNNLGRRKFHVEGAAAISHYQSEKVFGYPLVDPHVDEAVEGIMEFWAARPVPEPEAVPA